MKQRTSPRRPRACFTTVLCPSCRLLPPVNGSLFYVFHKFPLLLYQLDAIDPGHESLTGGILPDRFVAEGISPIGQLDDSVIVCFEFGTVWNIAIEVRAQCGPIHD